MNRSEVYDEFGKIRASLERLMSFVSSNDIVPKDGCASYCYGTAQVRMNDLTEAVSRTMVSVAQLAEVKDKEKQTSTQIESN